MSKPRRDKFNTVSTQRYFDELRAADQRALQIKQTADDGNLVLAREIQTYKDEQHNGLLQQLGEERTHYVTQDQHRALTEKLETLIKPVTEYMISQQGSMSGVHVARLDRRMDWQQVMQLAATIATLITLLLLIVASISHGKLY